jgi:hypothetical protein
MRYYVLCTSDVAGILPHIVAEVVHDVADGAGDRGESFAGSIAGARSVIATRQELMDDPDTRRSMEEWEGQNDAQFDLETSALSADDEPIPHRDGNVFYLDARRATGPARSKKDRP